MDSEFGLVGRSSFWEGRAGPSDARRIPFARRLGMYRGWRVEQGYRKWK